MKPAMVDHELEQVVARARSLANRAEHDLRDDAGAVTRVHALQARLRSALNAVPPSREDVLTVAADIERELAGT